jgi:alpha-tubulin suppressor-like RCC1 family protein
VDWHVRSVQYSTTVPQGLSNVVAIAAGSDYGLALRRDGTVLGWGANRTGAATGVPSPVFPNEATGTVMIAGQVLSNVVAIAADADHSLALKSNGTVVSWGSPLGRELAVPAGLTNVISIAAGENFCLAVTTNPAPTFRRQ